MSLDHAILGFLSYGPSSGYDLKKRFDTSVQHFWPADQSQIYRTLARLADNGWANVQVVTQKDAPDRKVYHITPEGRDELLHWLTTPLPPSVVRSSELIQVFFAGLLSDEEIQAMFQQAAEKLRKTLRIYQAIQVEASNRDVLVQHQRDAFFWSLTLENGIYSTFALLEWVEDVIQRLVNQDYEIRFAQNGSVSGLDTNRPAKHQETT